MTVTFGEILLRLSTPDRILQADGFDAMYGGSEANVACALAGFGEKASYITKLPANDIGDACIAELRKYGVDTDGIVRGGERMGLYFLEKGASHRPSKVIYDRKNSAISAASLSDFSWNRILRGADTLFLSGITPAIGKKLPAVCKKLLDTAKSMGIRVYFDVNYRAALWSEAEAGACLSELLPLCDVVIINEEHAAKLFGITGEGDTDTDRIASAARQISETFALDKAVFTLRRSISSDDNEVSAFLYDASAGTSAMSRTFKVHIVDRVGGGDALSAALIYGEKQGMEGEALINFASAANAFKHAVKGDVLIASFVEILALSQSREGEGVRLKR